MARRELTKQKKKVQSQQNHTTLAEEQTSCLSGTVLKKKADATSDRQEKEELEGYVKDQVRMTK